MRLTDCGPSQSNSSIPWQAFLDHHHYLDALSRGATSFTKLYTEFDPRNAVYHAFMQIFVYLNKMTLCQDQLQVLW